MKHNPSFAIQVAVVTLLTLTSASLASAQSRMSDKDIESLMNNLQNDTKTFRSAFDSALGKSTIRKTSQEKDAKSLVENFHNQTENMLKEFKSKKKADQALSTVLASSDQIDQLLATTAMGEQTTDAWAKVKSELGMLAQQIRKTL
jgi:biotin-(acetyl-CoA carboxylase) ligase